MAKKKNKLQEQKDKTVNGLAYLAGNIDNAKAIFMVSVVETENGDDVSMMCFNDGNMSHLEMLGLSKIFEQKIADYMIETEIDNFKKEMKRRSDDDDDDEEDDDDR